MVPDSPVLSHFIRTVTQGGGRVIPTSQVRKLRPSEGIDLARLQGWRGAELGSGLCLSTWDLISP